MINDPSYPKSRVAHLLQYSNPSLVENPGESRIFFGSGFDPKIILPVPPEEQKWQRAVQISRSNHWIAEEVPLVKDALHYETLDEMSAAAFRNELAYLTTADSTVPSFVGEYTSKIVTSFYVRNFIARQMEEENIHVASYQTMFDELGFPVEKSRRLMESTNREKCLRDKINWNIKHGRELAKVVARITEFDLGGGGGDSEWEALKEEATRILFKGLVAYTIFEFVLFPVGFTIFFSIYTHQRKMPGTDGIFRYIYRDEQLHARNSIMLIHALLREWGKFVTKQDHLEASQLFYEAFELEKSAADLVFPDGKLGGAYSKEEYLGYVKYLSNVAAKELRMIQPFPEVSSSSPLPWMQDYYKPTATNIFESKNIAYSLTPLTVKDFKKAELSENDISGLVGI
jgi:ribonucleoside-diphosphate reductase beta chain